MGEIIDTITPQFKDFIEAQHIFFVATAPLSAEGHINVSPKGLDVFRVLGPNRVAYLDLTGSGNETAAHTQENGRITFMFCSFETAPRILRLYGTGRAVLPQDDEWAALIPQFPDYPGVRQIIVGEIAQAQSSCGFGVPLFDYAGEREAMVKWEVQTGPEGLADYRAENNATSIDGLPVRLRMP